MIYMLISVILVICGLSAESVGILAVAVLFAFASKIEIDIHRDGNDRD